MPTTVPNFPISQRMLENGSCAALSRCGKRNDSWQYTRLYVIFSIFAVTSFQRMIIDFSDCVLLRLGVGLLRDGQYLLKSLEAE